MKQMIAGVICGVLAGVLFGVTHTDYLLSLAFVSLGAVFGAVVFR